jgi:hypothetical protein
VHPILHSDILLQIGAFILPLSVVALPMFIVDDFDKNIGK